MLLVSAVTAAVCASSGESRAIGEGGAPASAPSASVSGTVPTLSSASAGASAPDGPGAPAAAESGGQGLGKGRLRGEVSFSRQEPVVGATVVLVRADDPRTLIAGSTDREGGFRFEGIPEGTWTVGVVSEGAAPVVKEGIVVKPPARAVVDIPMKKSAVRMPPPVFDLARFERAGSSGHLPISPSQGDAAIGAQEESTMPASAADAAMAWIRVVDASMKPVREARVAFRSRGPSANPVRGLTDGEGVALVHAPAPGEYTLRVEMPGYLPVRVERLVLGREAPRIGIVLTPRPLDYPARPADLLPEERPVPPEGFPGAPASRPSGAAEPSRLLRSPRRR